jgi:hypothetical protein
MRGSARRAASIPLLFASLLLVSCQPHKGGLGLFTR